MTVVRSIFRVIRRTALAANVFLLVLVLYISLISFAYGSDVSMNRIILNALDGQVTFIYLTDGSEFSIPGSLFYNADKIEMGALSQPS
jgi:hypothetical protein